MAVKLEAREFELEKTIKNLQSRNAELLSVMSKGKWVFNQAGTIRMTVLPCIESENLQSIDMKQIIHSAREMIQYTLQNSDTDTQQD